MGSGSGRCTKLIHKKLIKKLYDRMYTWDERRTPRGCRSRRPWAGSGNLKHNKGQGQDKM